MSSSHDDASPEQVASGTQIARFAKRNAFIVSAAGCGILLTLFLVAFAPALQDRSIKSDHHSDEHSQPHFLPAFPHLHILSEPVKKAKTGGFRLGAIRQIVTRPRFIVIASVVLVVLVAVVSVTLYLVLRKQEPVVSVEEAPVAPAKPSPAPVVAESDGPSLPPGGAGFRWSSLITALIMIVVFAVGLFLLFKFGVDLDIKVKLAVVLALLAIFFLFVRFEDVVLPYLTWGPKRLIAMAADASQ